MLHLYEAIFWVRERPTYRKHWAAVAANEMSLLVRRVLDGHFNQMMSFDACVPVGLIDEQSAERMTPANFPAFSSQWVVARILNMYPMAEGQLDLVAVVAANLRFAEWNRTESTPEPTPTPQPIPPRRLELYQ